jgi:hypothetical protein
VGGPRPRTALMSVGTFYSRRGADRHSSRSLGRKAPGAGGSRAPAPVSPLPIKLLDLHPASQLESRESSRKRTLREQECSQRGARHDNR